MAAGTEDSEAEGFVAQLARLNEQDSLKQHTILNLKVRRTLNIEEN